jgi:hypothetical protein
MNTTRKRRRKHDRKELVVEGRKRGIYVLRKI